MLLLIAFGDTNTEDKTNIFIARYYINLIKVKKLNNNNNKEMGEHTHTQIY